MNNKFKIILAVLILLFGVISYLDYIKPKPIDWSETYSIKDKIPFGLYVFDKEFPKMRMPDTVQKVNTTLFEFLEPNYSEDLSKQSYEQRGTVFSVSNFADLDSESEDELLNFVAEGNTAFLSNTDFSKKLQDSLHFELEPYNAVSDSSKVWLSNENIGSEKYFFNRSSGTQFFSKIDTLQTTVLGYQGNNQYKKINFIQIKYQDGFFYLHTQPACFTNYFLLDKTKYAYSQKVVSYLPRKTIFWLTKAQDGAEISDSPLRFIFSKPALKWGWYILIFGIFVFILFNAKRKQRVVPIEVPLANTTVYFTKTIANLYYQEGDYQTIINKKIIYFLEKARNEYLMDTTVLDAKFIARYQQKTGKNLDDIQDAMLLINYHKKQQHQSVEPDLLKISKAIEKIS